MCTCKCVCWKQTPSGKAGYGAARLRKLVVVITSGIIQFFQTHLSENWQIPKPGFLQPERFTKQKNRKYSFQAQFRKTKNMLTNDSEVTSHMCTCKNMCCHMCMREEGKNKSQSADKLHGDTGGQKHIFTQSNYSLVWSRRGVGVGVRGWRGRTECHHKKNELDGGANLLQFTQ